MNSSVALICITFKRCTMNMKIMAAVALLVCTLAGPSLAQDLTKPLTLGQAIEIAFENNPRIKIAVDQYARATGVVMEARSRLKPRVNVSVTHTRQGPPVTVQFGGMDVNLVQEQNTAAAANLTLPLDIGRQLATATNLTRYQEEMDRLNIVAQYQQLILDVSNSFYELRRAKSAAGVAQTAVNTAQARLRNTTLRFNAGVAPKFDVDTGEVEVANLTQRLISTQHAVEMARFSLNTTLGIDVLNPTEAAEEPVVLSTEPIDKARAVGEAIVNRPEVQTAELAISAAKFGTRLARLNNAPALGLSATYNYSLNVGGFNATKGTWMAVFQLSKNIWDGGETRAKVVQALADERRASDTLAQVKQGVSLDAATAVVRVTDAADRAATATKSVALAQEALRLANVRYEAGVSTQLEVQNAEQQLTEAQFNEVNAQYDYAEAAAALEKARAAQPQMAAIVTLVPATKL